MFSFLRDLTQRKDNPTIRLMKAMRFGGKDLDLNRQGILSDSQKRLLRQDFWGYGILTALLMPWFIIIFTSLFRPIMPDRGAGHPSIYFLAAVVGFTILLFICVLYWQNKNIAKAHVVAFTGRVKKLPAHRQYVIMVINHRDRAERLYNVGYWVYHAFIEDETYSVYSLSFDQMRAVAAEHLPSK
jgi:hypothetical protein